MSSPSIRPSTLERVQAIERGSDRALDPARASPPGMPSVGSARRAEAGGHGQMLGATAALSGGATIVQMAPAMGSIDR